MSDRRSTHWKERAIAAEARVDMLTRKLDILKSKAVPVKTVQIQMPSTGVLNPYRGLSITSSSPN